MAQSNPRGTLAIERPAAVTLAVSPVVSMAILKVNSDRLNVDLIEQFVPFIADALRQRGDDVVSANELQTTLQELFGLTMPIGALKVVLGRCAKRGLVTQKNGVYTPARVALDAQPNLLASRATVLRQHQALLDKLRAHALSVFKMELTEETAEDALLRYVALRAAPLLTTAVEGAPIVRMGPNGGDDLLLLVDAFVVALSEADPDGFEYLSTIVKGSVLASALYLQGDIGNAARGFTNVVFYIDTPILVRALGFCPSEQSVGSRELLELLRAEGAQLAVFSHNLEEVNGILDRAHRDVADPRRHRQAAGESVRFFLDSGVSATDIVEKQGSLRADLEGLGFVIRETPPTTRHNSVDEEGLAKALTPVGYRSEDQRLVDVASLTAVWRLREAKTVRRLEDARAVFVTSNNALVNSSRTFFGGEQGYSAIPIALADHVLATLAWLKKPNHRPDLPTRMVVADCYSALCPPDEAWPAYLALIKDLASKGKITEHDLTVLSHDLQVRALVIRQTRRSTEPFTEGNVREVLGVARASIAADKDAQARAAEAARAAATTQAGLSAELAEKAQREQARLAGEVDAAHRQRELDVESTAARLAGIFVKGAYGAVVLAIVVYQVLAAPKPLGRALPPHLSGWISLLASMMLIFGLVASNAGAIGLGKWLGRESAERWLSARLATALRYLRDGQQ